MVDLVHSLIGELRLGRRKGGGTQSFYGPRQFSARANNLWRVGRGSNAAVLKKIYNGGTHTPKQLGNQLNYLFSKANAIFGNHVSHDPQSKTLTLEQCRNGRSVGAAARGTAIRRICFSRFLPMQRPSAPWQRPGLWRCFKAANTNQTNGPMSPRWIRIVPIRMPRSGDPALH